MIFYLGTHQTGWLETMDVPLFVSRRRLATLKKLPRAIGSWALDSGGFTELSMHGAWTVTAREYVAEVRRFRDEIGGMQWAAPQDWMCEPDVRAKTGLSVGEHQAKTIVNFLELRALAPELPIVPVLQGWSVIDYWRHIDAYEAAGVDLAEMPLVGVGTVCRRQSATQGANIISTLEASGLKLHGFGFKVTGLRACAPKLASADSLAWSLNARKNSPLPECTHKSCSSCPTWALEWRRDLLATLEKEHARSN